MNKLGSKFKRAAVYPIMFATFFIALFTGMPVKVYAADNTVLPSWINDIVNSFQGGPSKYVNDRVRLGLTVLFVGVFIVAIAYSALAAIKFMSSQGDSGKLEESKGAVKAILMGFAAMLIAIVGIFFVVTIFGGATNEIEQEFNLNVPK